MTETKTYNISNIEIAQFFVQSLDYQALMERIAEKQEMVQLLQETGKIDRALKAAAELDELEHQKEQLKENVLRLYETFTKIEINSESIYAEALQIRHTLASATPRTYLPDAAMTLINLSIFYLQATPDKDRSLALATKVLDIAQQFPQVPSVQRYAETARQVLQAHGVEVDA